jgi:L-alanine-DL-glutamate epimerase-like enolase superfamily enzyme
VQQIATAHFGASVRNFVMSETRIDSRPLVKAMCQDDIDVVGGQLQVPLRPGLGITLDEDYLRAHRAEGEPYWRD